MNQEPRVLVGNLTGLGPTLGKKIILLSGTDTPGITAFPVPCTKNQAGSSHFWTLCLVTCHGAVIQEENHFGVFSPERMECLAIWLG